MTPLVGVVMGSTSDWEAMKQAARQFEDFGVPYEAKVMSAHRTPALVEEYVSGAAGRGMKCIIAGAGGAAHLAGVCASFTTLPVLGVPMASKLDGLDSLLSGADAEGIPVATFAIGEAGAANAALFAIAMLALEDKALAKNSLLSQEAGRGGGQAAAETLNDIRRAAEILRRGGLVAFHGNGHRLGADAAAARRWRVCTA
jgi:5-(carboxyamino)imidazole ribonucleotide mutase